MRVRMLACAAMVVASASPLLAAEIESGVPVGGKIGTYSTTKCGGIEDGVKVGSSLCYTWKLGGRPVVFMFAKTPSDGLASLVKQIDKIVAENSENKMAAVLNFVDEPSDAYTDKIKEFGEKHNITNVALTITGDASRFKVNENANLTVLTYKGKTVQFNFASEQDPTTAEIKAIVAGASKLTE